MAPDPVPIEPVVCPEWELGLPDGRCIRPGIPPNGCEPGFAHDGAYGCEPILPAAPCGDGLMATPGELQCRPVSPCAAGRWGDIAVDAASEYVDAAYTVGDSDGSEQKPWSTIGDAVSAAAPGSVIAVAAGSYDEDVVIQDKPIVLWGVCPERVVIAGTGALPAAISIGASNTVIRALAVRGSAFGVLLDSADDVVLDRVWVHDTNDRGVNVQAASVQLSGALLEGCRGLGAYIAGASATFEGTVVRETLPRMADQGGGRGIGVQVPCGPTGCDSATRSSATVRGSVVELNHDIGVFVAGSDLTIEGSVVRSTQPQAADQENGRGIVIQVPCDNSGCSASPSIATVRGSVVEQNRDYGIFLMGSELRLETTVVRTTSARASDQRNGRGINAQVICHPSGGCDPSARSRLELFSSLIDHNQDVGVYISGSDATVDSTVVRATGPESIDMTGGRGISLQSRCSPGMSCDPAWRGNATLRASLVEQSHEVGVYVSGSDALIEDMVVRDTLPQAADLMAGRGVHVTAPCSSGFCDSLLRGNATIDNSIIERNHDVGLWVADSDVYVSGSVVRATNVRDADGLMGDGMFVASQLSFVTLTLTGVQIEDSARAGLANFGANVTLGSSQIRCAAFAMTGQAWGGHDFAFVDAGANACGCPAADGPCKAIPILLEPPPPLPEDDQP